MGVTFCHSCFWCLGFEMFPEQIWSICAPYAQWLHKMNVIVGYLLVKNAPIYTSFLKESYLGLPSHEVLSQ